MASLLVLGPIFEADLLDEQYGFREGLDAKLALRRVYYHLTGGHVEVVDGDIRDYAGTIPHGPLVKCVARRVADGRVLSTITAWLNAPVVERGPTGDARTTAAKDGHRGTPQGGVISPLLGNLYFRRVALFLRRSLLGQSGAVRLVNYADGLVLCGRPGRRAEATAMLRGVMTRIGLEVNEQKTRLVRLPEGQFGFLGHTFGSFYGRSGRPYLGTTISKKSLTRVLTRIHDETSTRWNHDSPEKRVVEVNRIVRGWCGYSDHGPIHEPYRRLRRYLERRVRRWLMKKHQRRGTGYRQYPDDYLYQVLGLYNPHVHRLGRARAKA